MTERIRERQRKSARIEDFIDAISDYAIYMLEPSGLVTSWNAGARNLFGYESSEIIGQHLSRFHTAEGNARNLAARVLREAETTGRHEEEGWRVRKDGSRFWANALLEAIRDESGELIGFAVIVRDKTERMRAHAALQEGERRFRLLVEGAIDYAIYMLDPSGVVTNWNPGAQRLKGYVGEEIVGHHFSRFFTREDRRIGLPARVLHFAARDGRYESEGWRVRKDGGRFWAAFSVYPTLDENGGLSGFCKITRDITERRAAHEAIRESERQLRLLIHGVADYALFMLDPNGIVCSWNMGARRIKGYDEEEIIGHHFSRFYTEPDRQSGMPARALQTAAQVGRFESEGWRVRKDGSLFWASAIIDAIRGDNGEVVGFAKITRDLTERRQAQLALDEARAKQAHAQKMEALGQLTGGVAHDFNNLLMIVSGYTQTIRKLVGDDPKGMRAIEAIEYAAKRGQSLTRQLLSFSRRQVLRPSVIRIAERLNEIRPILVSSVGRSVDIAMSATPDLWPVQVDESEFELALINLLINARDAMPDGGSIAISAENVHLRRGEAPQELEGDFVALTVSDTGRGIADDILPRVFDPFFTTKAVGKGSGLGLSQVYGFALQSHGAAVIKSNLGEGTSVTIFLPRERAAGKSESNAEPKEETVGESVLLIEDNPEVAAASAALIEEVGYAVETVGDAQAALESLARRIPDFVVSDIVMPGPMSGLGLVREIRRRHPKLPILLVTGYSDALVDAKAEFPVLRKPYLMADLHRALARARAEVSDSKPFNLVDLESVKKGRPLGPNRSKR